MKYFRIVSALACCIRRLSNLLSANRFEKRSTRSNVALHVRFRGVTWLWRCRRRSSPLFWRPRAALRRSPPALRLPWQDAMPSRRAVLLSHYRVSSLMMADAAAVVARLFCSEGLKTRFGSDTNFRHLFWTMFHCISHCWICNHRTRGLQVYRAIFCRPVRVSSLAQNHRTWQARHIRSRAKGIPARLEGRRSWPAHHPDDRPVLHYFIFRLFGYGVHQNLLFRKDCHNRAYMKRNLFLFCSHFQWHRSERRSMPPLIVTERGAVVMGRQRS